MFVRLPSKNILRIFSKTSSWKSTPALSWWFWTVDVVHLLNSVQIHNPFYHCFVKMELGTPKISIPVVQLHEFFMCSLSSGNNRPVRFFLSTVVISFNLWAYVIELKKNMLLDSSRQISRYLSQISFYQEFLIRDRTASIPATMRGLPDYRAAFLLSVWRWKTLGISERQTLPRTFYLSRVPDPGVTVRAN